MGISRPAEPLCPISRKHAGQGFRISECRGRKNRKGFGVLYSIIHNQDSDGLILVIEASIVVSCSKYLRKLRADSLPDLLIKYERYSLGHWLTFTTSPPALPQKTKSPKPTTLNPKLLNPKP